MTIMNTIKCDICGKIIPSEEAIYYEAGDYFVCKECWEDEFVECERCGDIISRDEAHKRLRRIPLRVLPRRFIRIKEKVTKRKPCGCFLSLKKNNLFLINFKKKFSYGNDKRRNRQDGT